MKRIIVLLLVLVLSCLAFASCEYIPDEVMDKIGPVLEKVGITGKTEEPPHEHEFVETKRRPATCMKEGVVIYTCSCGETKNEPGDPVADHDYEVAYSSPASCYKEGTVRYKCKVCAMSTTETIPATGEHVFDESTEASRIIRCSNSPCSETVIRDFSGDYKFVIVYTYSEDDLNRFYAIFAELEALINSAASYDPALHGYAEGTDLHTRYLAMEAKYEELYDELELVVGQYQIAQIEYYQDMSDETAKANFEYISSLRTELVAEFYSFSDPIYNSEYREFYYYGMTEQEILAFIFDSNAVSNPEYKALVDRNNEIELEFDAISNPDSSAMVLGLYAEFVENNNKIAQLMGYENYLEYAYSSIYDRDYTPEDVQTIAAYVKQYISPVYVAAYENWNNIASTGATSGAIEAYYNQVSDSFFETYSSNKTLNDYIDFLAFTTNPDKQMSFSDELNNAFTDGTFFRGLDAENSYEGAYVTGLYGYDTPIAYFGPGYDSAFTVVHEFGHYMNEKYNTEGYNQSYDLLEMHSQGNEILYLSYLAKNMDKGGYNLVYAYNTIVTLDTIVTALCVDTFEQAVYTNYYDGCGTDVIMADGKITSDEYDALFCYIIEDFGATGYVMEEYWRYVTIHAPCYYVSYSVSAISVLQLFPKAQEDFAAAVDSYTKLFTYIDEYATRDTAMTTEEILVYAGLYSFTDERLYQSIYETMYK